MPYPYDTGMPGGTFANQSDPTGGPTRTRTGAGTGIAGDMGSDELGYSERQLPSPEERMRQARRDQEDQRKAAGMQADKQLMDWYRAYKAGAPTAAEQNLAKTASSARNLVQAQAASQRGVAGTQAQLAAALAKGDMRNQELQQRGILRAQESITIEDLMGRYLAERQRLADLEYHAHNKLGDQADAAYKETRAQSDAADLGVIGALMGTIAGMFGSAGG